MADISAASRERIRLLKEEKNERVKLQDTIDHYKKNLIERDQALAEKEGTILELRNATRTLENFRFVLDNRLQQLSAERGSVNQRSFAILPSQIFVSIPLTQAYNTAYRGLRKAYHSNVRGIS
jgi:hypothetical protein